MPVQSATGLLVGEVLVGVFVKQILEVLYHPLKGIIEPYRTQPLKKVEKNVSWQFCDRDLFGIITPPEI